MAGNGAIIALVTGLVALGAAGVGLYTELQKNAQLVVDQRAEIARIRQEAQAAEHRQICANHHSALQVIEEQFTGVISGHSLLLNSLRACHAHGEKDAREKCAVVVCAIAYVGTDGGSNCLQIAADIDLIHQQFQVERDNLVADSCTLPSSRMATYFGD